MTFDKKKYDQAFAKEKYDRIPLNVKKGEREKIAKYAKEKGYNSITEYIKELIRKDMNNDSKSDINIGAINNNDGGTINFK